MQKKIGQRKPQLPRVVIEIFFNNPPSIHHFKGGCFFNEVLRGPAKKGLPAIDNPRFIEAGQAAFLNAV